MFGNKTLKIIFAGAVLLALAGYFSGLFIDVTRDAGKYATISKEIFQNGNFIHLTIHGEPYDQKPPMTFWLGTIGFWVGKVSNFWFKFPIVLLVFAGIYWAFRLGTSMYNKRVGYLTAIFLFFSFIYSLYSSDIHTDTPMQAFVTLSLWQLYEFIKTKKNKHWIIGFSAIGMAMLSKGPVGAAIPAFAVAGHILLKKDFRFLLNFKWYIGIILSVVLVSPALIGLINQFGWDGIRFFFWENNVGRITGTYIQANNDPVFYVHNLIYQFLPWSFLFYIAVFAEFRFLIKNKFRLPEYFTFAGIWIYFIILNSASSQLPNYIFGIMPLIAVLTAKWIDLSFSARNKFLPVFTCAQNFSVVLVWLIIVSVSFYLFPQPGSLFFIISGFAILTSLYIYFKQHEKIARLVLPSALAIASLFFLFNVYTLPFIFSYQAPPKAARFFTENKNANDTLYNYLYDQYELFFYSQPQAKQLHHEKLETIAGEKGTWIFTNPEGMAEIKKLNVIPDTIITYKHVYLNRPAAFFNPNTREEALQPMYLIRY